MTGIEAFLEILAGAGVRHLFGNPGTTELPLCDALAADPRFRYLFGLHEIPVVSMADGYAMASGGLGVANVHAACGLGNAMGMLYNARCEGTPLLLTAGQQDRRLRLGEPVLAGDLVRVAEPWTKWAVEVQRVEDIPAATRRAVQTALTPPTGPVFLALPLDLQMERVDGLDLRPPHIPDRRVRPPLDAVRRAAELLAQARRPVILAGSRVTESGGIAELAALAEQLGAPVFAENTTSHGRLPMPAGHPLYQGIVPFWTPRIRECLEPFDVALVVGMNLLRLYLHHEPACPLPGHLRLLHLDNVPGEIGKNFPVEVGLIGDPKTGLAELSSLLVGRVDAAAAERRREECAARRARERLDLLAEIESRREERPLSPLTLMSAIARVLPPRAAVIEEAPTTHQNLLEKLGAIGDPTGHFAHRGWALGWGLGCALGVKLAWPERPVLGLIGDGSALYGIQALWTAARSHIPVTFVICNNAEYRILKVCGDELALPHYKRDGLVGGLGVDLAEPAVDFVGLARAFGVAAHRVETAEELSSRLSESLAGDQPLLLEVPVRGG